MSLFVIAVCHQKGGVSKTTTVSALGAILAERGYRVLLVDMDASGNLTAGLGLNPANVKKSTADVLLGNDTLGMSSQTVALPGLSIVPSNGDMGLAAQFLELRPNFEMLLKNSFDIEMGIYDYVLIDCPPSLGPLAITSLVAADLAIVPTQCEYYSLQVLRNVFDAIKRVRTKFNPQLGYRLLISMFDQRGNLHAQVYDQIQKRYQDALFETVIGFDSKLQYSQVAGQPITQYAPKTRAAQQYRALTDEIIAYVESRKIS